MLSLKTLSYLFIGVTVYSFIFALQEVCNQSRHHPFLSQGGIFIYRCTPVRKYKLLRTCRAYLSSRR